MPYFTCYYLSEFLLVASTPLHQCIPLVVADLEITVDISSTELAEHNKLLDYLTSS